MLRYIAEALLLALLLTLIQQIQAQQGVLLCCCTMGGMCLVHVIRTGGCVCKAHGHVSVALVEQTLLLGVSCKSLPGGPPKRPGEARFSSACPVHQVEFPDL